MVGELLLPVNHMDEGLVPRLFNTDTPLGPRGISMVILPLSHSMDHGPHHLPPQTPPS